MKVRQEYLKQQRDKLLALKKQVREKRLGAAETDEDATAGENRILTYNYNTSFSNAKSREF